VGDGLVRRDQQLGLAETSGYHQKQTAKRERRVFRGVEEKIMIGLFFVGMGAIVIASVIIWLVINKIVLKDDE